MKNLNNLFLLIFISICCFGSINAQDIMDKKVKRDFQFTKANGNMVKGEWKMKKEIEEDGEVNEMYEIEFEEKDGDGNELEYEYKIKREIESDGTISVKIDRDLDDELRGNFERELNIELKTMKVDGRIITDYEIETEVEMNGKETETERKGTIASSRVTNQIPTANNNVNTNQSRNINSSVSTTSSYSSVDIPFDDLPPTSEYGKCYAKCKTPDTYETITVKRLVKEASTKLEKVPAQYETRTEKVLAKEGSTKYRTIPATFKTVTEQMMVEPEKRTLVTMPAKYKTETRQVLVSEARGQWVKKKKSPNCFSENPEDCYVACYEEIPAVYRTEKYEVLVEPARTEEKITPAKYKTVSKQVIDQPARVEEIKIEPTYKTVSKKVLIQPEATREITIPAVYKDVTEKRLVNKGNYTVWTEILCASKTTSSKVTQVQRALKAQGYDPGVIDGVMGVKTQTAMRQYQQDKNLPMGNMNIETLKSLGVNY